jgi:hypothetical protein
MLPKKPSPRRPPTPRARPLPSPRRTPKPERSNHRRRRPVVGAPSFDTKAFAGRYAAGDTALEVTDDGMFALTIGGATIDGTWTLQPDAKTVTLDPDSKSETDRQLEILSADTVSLAGTALKRAADKP